MDFIVFLFLKNLFYSYLCVCICVCVDVWMNEYPRKPIERYSIAGSWSYGQLQTEPWVLGTKFQSLEEKQVLLPTDPITPALQILFN